MLPPTAMSEERRPRSGADPLVLWDGGRSANRAEATSARRDVLREECERRKREIDARRRAANMHQVHQEQKEDELECLSQQFGILSLTFRDA